VAQARQVPGVVEVGLTRAAGADVVLRHSFQDRLGYIIASGETADAAAHAADEGLRALSADFAPAVSLTEGSPY
ncbi:MAG: hypothetical protein M3O55_02780, partial [Actinomycetota bacterium]|nr:hypothetical protein [Actinomycetota bacterium]